MTVEATTGSATQANQVTSASQAKEFVILGVAGREACDDLLSALRRREQGPLVLDFGDELSLVPNDDGRVLADLLTLAHWSAMINNGLARERLFFSRNGGDRLFCVALPDKEEFVVEALAMAFWQGQDGQPILGIPITAWSTRRPVYIDANNGRGFALLPLLDAIAKHISPEVAATLKPMRLQPDQGYKYSVLYS